MKLIRYFGGSFLDESEKFGCRKKVKVLNRCGECSKHVACDTLVGSGGVDEVDDGEF